MPFEFGTDIRLSELTKRFQMGQEQLKIMCYEDYTILVDQNEDDLQTTLHQFNIAAKANNMITSPEKNA